jgi:ATP-dependent DNA ligase
LPASLAPTSLDVENCAPTPSQVTSGAVFAGVPAPMLARLDSALPRGPAWCYEPKLDGFRGLLSRSESGTVRLLSRNLKDLSLSFPELADAAQSLPFDTVLDGEIVIADEHGNADFGALQRRLGAGKRGATDAAQRRPAVLLMFDLLRLAGSDLTAQPLHVRRAHLESLLALDIPCLQLVAQTSSVTEAEEWLTLLRSLEGVVAKRSDGRYLPGQRDWIKVKRHQTAECVVIGVAGDHTPPWLVLGLRHADGQLHRVGLALACSTHA